MLTVLDSVRRTWRMARSMAMYLTNLNNRNDYLFGYQFSDQASSAQHEEAILHMTDGIAVAILMSWVTDVMDLINKTRASRSREGVLDLSVVRDA
eukprot:1433623-Amphidinium_carterae.2